LIELIRLRERDPDLMQMIVKDFEADQDEEKSACQFRAPPPKTGTIMANEDPGRRDQECDDADDRGH
jgi:hypothetical protein